MTCSPLATPAGLRAQAQSGVTGGERATPAIPSKAGLGCANTLNRECDLALTEPAGHGQSAFPDRGLELTKDRTMKSMTKKKVTPVQPVAAYVGGKRNLAKTIVPIIDSIPHNTYAECFVGMGGIFLRRTTVPRAEVINDLNKDVATFFRVLQRHYQPFLDHLKYKLTSRAEFQRLLDCPPHTLTDIERSARFLYLQRLAFGGKVSGRNFGVSIGMSSRFNMMRLVPMLEDVYERLTGVVIEELDYKDFIQRYDSEGTLFYLDPPYWGTEGFYGRDLFDRAEFAKMAALLKGIKGTFILSLNDTRGVRDTFAGFHMAQVSTCYTVSKNSNAKEAGELLISNVKLTANRGAVSVANPKRRKGDAM